MSNTSLKKYKSAFLEAYNLRFPDVDPSTRQIAAENLFDSITDEAQLRSMMTEILKNAKRAPEIALNDSQPFDSFPEFASSFKSMSEKSREKPAQEKLQREIQELEERMNIFQELMRTRQLTLEESDEFQDVAHKRNEMKKKLKKTMDAAIRAQRYRNKNRNKAHYVASINTSGLDGLQASFSDSCPDSYPYCDPKRSNLSNSQQDWHHERFLDTSSLEVMEIRGLSSAASASSAVSGVSEAYDGDFSQHFQDSQEANPFQDNQEMEFEEKPVISIVKLEDVSENIDARHNFGPITDKDRGFSNNHDTPSEFSIDSQTSSRHPKNDKHQYICNQCDTPFETFNSFIEHMRSAHLKSNDPDLKCRICQASFSNSQARLAHMLEHFVSTNSSYSCHQCPNKHFESAQTFRQHFVSFHTDVLYRCSACLRVFSQNHAYQEHVMAHAVENTNFQCVVCTLTFETHELLLAHVQLVHDKDENLVTPMNGRRKRPSSMMGSMNGHSHPTIKVEAAPKNSNSSILKGLKCFVCDLECPDENVLDEHRLFNHCKVPKGDRCAVCHSTMHSYDDFVHHTQLHAAGMTEMSCVICRQTIRGESQLKMHGDYHLNSDEILNKCAYCDKHISIQDLAQHIFEHTMQASTSTNDEDRDSNSGSVDASPTFVCHCGQKFEVDSEFHAHALEHIKDLTNDAIRANDEPGIYKCPKCPKSFPSLSALQGHSHVHMGNRTYKCDLCTQSFTSIGRLENHKRKHQSGKEIQCQICDERFLRADLLQMHMRTHEVSLSSFINKSKLEDVNRKEDSPQLISE